MASTYLRKQSPFIWLRYKDETARWKDKPTGYRKDNPGDRRQAELLARRQSVLERERMPASRAEHWDAWVDAWMQNRYGQKSTAALTTTLTVYRRYWRRLRAWLIDRQLTGPTLVTFLDAMAYKDDRLADGVGINTIVHELKFLGVVMGGALQRGFIKANPCLKLGIKRDEVEGKEPWTEEAVAKAGSVSAERSDMIEATFLLGYFQAARLRQCEVPLKDIDLRRGRITYWRSLQGRPLTKGDKPFTQPIDPKAIPRLTALIERRKAGGHAALCDIPVLPSVEWRRFLDALELPSLSHHGLRTTWITRAALSGRISVAEAKRFVNHGSTAVHEIYQRLNADDVAHVPSELNLPGLA